jgi:hypothetical protein
LQNLSGREERAVGKAKALIATCLWVAGSLAPALAFGTGNGPFGRDDLQRAFSRPYPFALSEEPDSTLHANFKGLRLAPWQVSSSTALDETVPALQGVKGRYEIGLGNYSFEFSGSYLPGMRSLVPAEAPFDPRAHLGYIHLTIPVSQFFLEGGAFFGHNTEALGLSFKRPSKEQNPERELFGYQIGGGYRFSDSLSIQAGWGQAAQEYETTREGLRAWYLQAQISLGWRMSVTPHVGFTEFTTGDGDKIREEAFYCGARWQISF